MIGLRGPSAKGVRAAGDQPASAGKKKKAPQAKKRKKRKERRRRRSGPDYAVVMVVEGLFTETLFAVRLMVTVVVKGTPGMGMVMGASTYVTVLAL